EIVDRPGQRGGTPETKVGSVQFAGNGVVGPRGKASYGLEVGGWDLIAMVGEVVDAQRIRNPAVRQDDVGRSTLRAADARVMACIDVVRRPSFAQGSHHLQRELVHERLVGRL